MRTGQSRLSLANRVLLASGSALGLFACAGPGPVLPAREADPAPLLSALEVRSAGRAGFSADLELEHTRSGRRSRAEAFLLLAPPGLMRLEVPGPFGSTLLVLVAGPGGTEAFLPGENRAFSIPSSSLPGLSDPPRGLPFPLPASSPLLPALALGLLPPGSRTGESRAFADEDGRSVLLLPGPEGVLLRYTFTSGRLLLEAQARDGEGEIVVRFSRKKGGPPEKIVFRGRTGTLTSRVRSPRFSPPPAGAFDSPIPPGIPVDGPPEAGTPPREGSGAGFP